MTRKEAIKHLRSLVGIFNHEALKMAISALEYKLEPCPFCGSEEVELIEPDYISTDSKAHCCCPQCFATVDFHTEEETTIKKWNERSSQ